MDIIKTVNDTYIQYKSRLIIAGVVLLFYIVSIAGAWYLGSNSKDNWWREYVRTQPTTVVHHTAYIEVAPKTGTAPAKPKDKAPSSEDSAKIAIYIQFLTSMNASKDSVIAVLSQRQETTFGNKDSLGIVWVEYLPAIISPTKKPLFNWKISPAAVRVDSFFITQYVVIPLKWYEKPVFLISTGIVIGVGIIETTLYVTQKLKSN